MPRPRISWDALRVFVVVHRLGSFSAAADELGLAQSSVSDQIARLERRLGHPLLERGPFGVRATDRGLELIARVAGHVDALETATAMGSVARDEPRTVFLGGPAEFLSEVVLPGLANDTLPGVHIAARFGLAEELLVDLRVGTVDVLISVLPARGIDIESEPVYDEEFVLVASPDWRERAVEDLESVPLLAYGQELPIVRRYWRSVFGRRPERLDAKLTAPDLRTLLRLALDGAGMSVLPDYLVREHLGSGTLIELHEPEVAPLNTLYVATRRRTGRSDPAVTAVREAVATISRAAG